MKILAIRIRNLASLEGNTEIDFTQEPLSRAGIFAMTGPTGAGKSTILDALCLALYGKTPRYKQADSGVEVKNINQGDVRGILRDGAADGYAEVDFAGVNGQHYRAKWSVRRAHNRAEGRLQEYDIALMNISTGAELPGTKTELLKDIERVVGLNFEQFTRSVLLAQGEFTAFLKAGKDEKSSLLEKLTGTQIYSRISVCIYERHKEESLKLRDLNTQRDGVPTLTPEELEQLGQQQQALTISLRSLEQQISRLKNEIDWYRQLHNLQLQVEDGVKQHTEAAAARANAAPRIAKLQQVEQVQAVRTPVENLQATKPQLTRQEEQLHEQKGLLALLIQEQEQHSLLVRQTEDLLAVKMQEQEDATPLLIRARELDIHLGEKKQQIKLAEDELKYTQVKLQQVNENLNRRQQEEKDVGAELTRLTQWKEDNASLQKVAEHESLIVARLKDAAQVLNTETETSQHIQSLDKNIERKQTEKEKATKDLQIEEAALKTIGQEYEAIQLAIDAIPLQSLEQEKVAIDDTVQQLTQAVAQWQLVYAVKQELKQADERMGKLKQSLDEHTMLLTPAETALNSTRLQKETAQQLLDKARLAATESVQQLRQHLIHNEPCPVCGSVDHPYAAENPQLQYVLSELEDAFRLKDQEFTSQLGEFSRLQEVVRKLTDDIQVQEKAQSQKLLQAAELNSVWVSFTVSEECYSVTDPEKAGWLNSRLQQHTDRRGELQLQIQSVRTRQELANSKRNECDRLERRAVEIGNNIKDADRALISLQEQQAQRKLELQNAHTIHANIKTELEDYFASATWIKAWETDPATFTEQVQQNASHWRNNERSLDELTLRANTLSVTLTSLQEQVIATGNEVEQKQRDLDERTLQYDKVAAERRALFGGKPVIEIEKVLQAAISNARLQVDESHKRREELQGRHTRTTTQIEQTDNQVNFLKQQLHQLQEQVAQWLSLYNESGSDVLTEEEVIELLNFSTGWIDDERTAIRELDLALSRAHAVLTERQTALEQHHKQQQPNQTAEELQVLLDETKKTQSEQSGQLSEIQVQIKNDAGNRKLIGNLLEKIQEQSKREDNWAKLNEVIGSADGKKFRQVAQEFTLDVLLGFANVHLEVLNRRYLLQRIPNTLGLQVVDRDMGDEVRTVYSLSGGESFLVSLALALGLASLSSSRMQVESLFIDEGFGSLDLETLNIAMDALERLHNQGRKVGVISHVQEMTERIPVQIKVSKQQSGKSRVEVVGV